MELVLGLVGALIGATAVVVAQLVSARTSVTLESDKQRRSDVATATRSLLRALQAQEWLVWKAAHDPASLTDGYLADYDLSVYAALDAASGDLGVLAATWPPVYSHYGPLAERVFEFDVQIAAALVELRNDRDAGLERLVAVSADVLGYHWYVYKQVRRIVEGESLEVYDAATTWAARAAP